jgi:DNA-binding transcriptional MerR regulator
VPESFFTLSQIAELTQIPSQTIYAWERRYKAIVPSRTATGRRVYTGKQLLRIKLLRACIDQGARIGSIAGLSDASLDELLRKSREGPLEERELLNHAISLDHDELDRTIGLGFATLGAASFADVTLSPLMVDLGVRWRSDPSAILAEHTVTTTAKSLLFTALRLNRPRLPRATAIFATPTGELHELGLLSSAVAAQACGVLAIYLGPQVPTELLPEIVKTSEAQFVVMASSALEPGVILPSITALRHRLPDDIKLVVGGQSFARLGRTMPSGIRTLDTIRGFESYLRSCSL